MRLIQAKASLAVDYMAEHILDDPDTPKEELIEIFKGLLKNNLHYTFCLQAYDTPKAETEDITPEPELKGFIFAVAPERKSYVWVVQAWGSADLLQTSVPDVMFYRLVIWAQEKHHRTEIRMETTRATRAFIRRWGFQDYSKIMSFPIPSDYELQVFEGKHKRITNQEEGESDGTIERAGDRDDVQSDGATATDSESPGSGVDGEDVPADPSIPGPTGGSDDGGSAEGIGSGESVGPPGGKGAEITEHIASAKRTAKLHAKSRKDD